MYHPRPMGLEHLLNAEFDLSLRPRWRPPVGETARHRISDLAWHALFLAEPGDSVLVPEPAPEDFIEYLGRSGIEAPTLTIEPGQRNEQRLSPFGWNAGAADRNQHYDHPVEHPTLNTITRVNGRGFSAAFEEEIFGGDHVVSEFGSETDLLGFFKRILDSPTGWVLKAEHGNAGLGNRRLRSRELSEGDLGVIHRFFEEDDSVVLEHWRPRLRDLCAAFTVTETGEISSFGLHEVVNTADGALIGALFEEDPGPLAQWRPDMEDAAMVVAGRLVEEGYFGPACMDAFVWEDAGLPRLRPLVDLNARREMSAAASALWRRLGGRGAAYWRFFTRRKLRLPETYLELEEELGRDAFDSVSGTGALATAPLWLGPDRRPPAKTAMLLLGRNRDAVLALDHRLRERFEK